MELIALISKLPGSSVIFVVLGVAIGWIIPQPGWAQTLTDKVCEKLKLDRFHKDGHAHSESHSEECLFCKENPGSPCPDCDVVLHNGSAPDDTTK